MLRLIRNGLQFLMITGVLYVASMWVLAHVRFNGLPIIFRTCNYYKWKGGVAYAKFKDFDPRKRYDVLVIGSSHAYRGYDPDIFAERHLRMFNLGNTAQTPMNSYHLLKAYGDTAHTRFVILDIYDNLMDGTGLESASDMLLALPSNSAMYGMLFDLHDIRAVNLAALRLVGRDIQPMFKDSGYAGEGYARTVDSLKLPVKYDPGKPLVVDHEQLGYIRKCIDLCKERGIPIVCVTHFYPKATDPARHKPFHHTMDSLLTGAGVPYFDFAYDHHVSDHDHFFDNNHLNAAGVRIFNERLLDSLERRGWMAPDGVQPR